MSPSLDPHPPELPAATMIDSGSSLLGSLGPEFPRNPSIIDNENESKQLNSSFQLAWSKVMGEGSYSSTRSYKRVHALLLSWDDEFDDLKVKEEVDTLDTVFTEVFHFHVRNTRLTRHKNRTAQAYINKIVADWVWEYDGVRTLLIVYFAGHGRKGQGNLLHLAGKTSPMSNRDHLDSVIWNRTEENLRDTQADILEIFDCCYAGNLMSTRGGSQGFTKAFEYLGAVGPDLRTPGPGEKSFTKALIWALKELAGKSERFTTTNLLDTIQMRAPGFSRSQKPILTRRTNAEMIMLEPLKTHIQDDATSSPHALEDTVSPPSPKDILTLKFVFDDRPNLNHIEALGGDLNLAVQRHHLQINRIMWGGIRRHDPVNEAATLFKDALARRRGSYQKQLLSLSEHVLQNTEQIHEELEEVHHEVTAQNSDLAAIASLTPSKRPRLE